MPTVGVREFKNNATKIVRAVREEAAEYVITVDGQPVAVLRPYTVADENAGRRASVEAILARVREIAAEQSAQADPNVSGVEGLIQDREDRWRSSTQAS